MREFPQQWDDIIHLLFSFRLLRSEILAPGGGKSPLARRIDSYLIKERGWIPKNLNTKIVIDGVARDNPTHEIDCYKDRVGLELEWNNKTEFYDRDLNNFRILFDLQAIDVGVILTRGSELQKIFDGLGKGSSYGSSTTHYNKLVPRILGGGAGGCPILAFGMSKELYVEDEQPVQELEVLSNEPPSETLLND